jgi:hypothetical protein
VLSGVVYLVDLVRGGRISLDIDIAIDILFHQFLLHLQAGDGGEFGYVNFSGVYRILIN